MRKISSSLPARQPLLPAAALARRRIRNSAKPPIRIEGATADPDGGATMQTVIYRDGPQMRVETALPNYGPATIVFDESTNAAYVLNPDRPTPAAAPAATAPPTTTAAGRQPNAAAPAQRRQPRRNVGNRPRRRNQSRRRRPHR